MERPSFCLPVAHFLNVSKKSHFSWLTPWITYHPVGEKQSSGEKNAMATMTELSPTAGKYSQDVQGDEKLSPGKGKLNLDYVVLGFYGGFLQYRNTKK